MTGQEAGGRPPGGEEPTRQQRARALAALIRAAAQRKAEAGAPHWLTRDGNPSPKRIRVATGVSDQHVARWLAGESLPGAQHVVQLADLYGASRDAWLLAAGYPPLGSDATPAASGAPGVDLSPKAQRAAVVLDDFDLSDEEKVELLTLVVRAQLADVDEELARRRARRSC